MCNIRYSDECEDSVRISVYFWRGIKQRHFYFLMIITFNCIGLCLIEMSCCLRMCAYVCSCEQQAVLHLQQRMLCYMYSVSSRVAYVNSPRLNNVAV